MNSSIKNFTRGGQTLLHNFRMINQIMNRVLIFCFIAFIFLTGLITYHFSTDYQLYLVWELLLAKGLYFFDSNSKLDFINPGGNTTTVLCKQIINATFIQAAAQTISRSILKAILLSLMLAVASFTVI